MLSVNSDAITVENFPAGEQRLKLAVKTGFHHNVEWKYESEDELITLIYLSNHIKTHGGKLGKLYIPYFPNARMDRVVNDGEVFTLKYFCGLINSLGFENVYVNNPHSDVCMGLLNNAKDGCFIDGTLRHNNDMIRYLIKKLGFNPECDLLFYPDHGCAKKYESVLKFPYWIGHKQRNWETGKIEGYEIFGSIPSHPVRVLIVDDISSYGGTFYHAAERIRAIFKTEKVYLFVTHCENSILQGELIKSGYVDKIYTSDSIFIGEHPLIEVIKTLKES